MRPSQAPDDWIGNRVDDVYGGRLGRIADLYVDEPTGRPAWALIRLGRFGDEHVPVPLDEAVHETGRLWVPYDRQLVRAAPRIRPGVALSREVDLEIARHFGRLDSRREQLEGVPDGEIASLPLAARQAPGSGRATPGGDAP